MASTSEINVEGLGDVKLGVATWNVGNANPLDSFTKIWPDRGDGFDICVMGMQESTYTDEEPNDEYEDREGMEDVVDTKKANKEKAGDEDTDRKSTGMQKRASTAVDLGFGSYLDLEGRMRRAFNGTDIEEDDDEWKVVTHCFRAQMQIYVMARKHLVKHITNIEDRVENTGFLHIFPNKGGLLVSFELMGTSLAFISCHLTAHEGVAYCGMRNDSIKEILGGVRVGDERFDVSNQKHHLFFMGDMNYRTCFDSETPPRSKRDENLTKEEEEQRTKMIKQSMGGGDDDNDEGGKKGKVSKKDKVTKQIGIVMPEIEKNDWAAIIARDELNREIAGNRALAGFNALTPSFPPTFKRKRHVGLVKTSGKWYFQALEDGSRTEKNETVTWKAGEAIDPMSFYDKKRTPSYTDRILYRSMPHFTKNCVPEAFISFEEVGTSDHKPVRATFNITPTKGASDILVNSNALDLTPHDLIKGGEGFELIISKMSGRHLAEMDWGGGSDPYMVATSDPPALISVRNKTHVTKSRYLVNNLNPDWGAEELRVPIVSCDVEGIARNAHLYLSVWDYDLTNEDDLIGLARIPFAAIFEAAKNKKPYVYDEDVYENGEICGSIQGEITLSQKYKEIAKKLKTEGAVSLSDAEFIEVPDCMACCNVV